MSVKQRSQIRHLQHLAGVPGHVAQLQVAALLPDAGQAAHDSSKTAAVHERHLTKVKDDGFAIAQQPCDMGSQRLTLFAGHDASVAANDGDSPDIAGFER